MEFTDLIIITTSIAIVAWAYRQITKDERSARNRWKKLHPGEFNWGV